MLFPLTASVVAETVTEVRVLVAPVGVCTAKAMVYHCAVMGDKVIFYFGGWTNPLLADTGMLAPTLKEFIGFNKPEINVIVTPSKWIHVQELITYGKSYKIELY